MSNAESGLFRPVPLKDGRLLGVEVTAAKGKLRPGQAVFLERIRRAGGMAFVARNCRDVMRELEGLKPNRTAACRPGVPAANRPNRAGVHPNVLGNLAS